MRSAKCEVRSEIQRTGIVKTTMVFVMVVFSSTLFAGATELDVWNMPTEADKHQRKVWEEGVHKFQMQYPKIKINGISREYKPQEFVSVMASGKGPDVVRIPITAIPIMAKYGFLTRLNEFTDRWIQKDYMPAIMWGSVEVDGGVYGVPYDSFFTTLFYRKDIFEKCGIRTAPETWQDIIDFSVIIQKKMKNVWGIALQPNMFNFIDFIWQAGGDVELNGAINLNAPSVIKALKFWHDLKWKEKVMPPQNILYEYDVEQLFSTGKVAMMIGVAKRLPVMSRRYGLDINRVQIVPMPAGPDGIKAWHAGGDAFIINSDITGKKKKYAWEYIRYMLSPPHQLWKWVIMNEMKNKYGMIIFPGDFSCATNLINMPEFSQVKGLLSFAHAEPTYHKWPMIKEDFDRYVLEKIFISKNIDYESLLYKFSERVKKEYHGR